MKKKRFLVRSIMESDGGEVGCTSSVRTGFEGPFPLLASYIHYFFIYGTFVYIVSALVNP